MRTSIAVVAFALVAVMAYAADENPLAGKWATDAVATAEIPQTQGAFGKALAGAVNGGNSKGGFSSNDTTQPQKGGGSSVSIDDPAVILDLKVDPKSNKLTGTISEITPRVIKKLNAEKGTVTGKKFEFDTVEKSESSSTTIHWAGELTDEKTVTVMRLTKSGNPIDDKALLFRRAGK